ncbi:methyltransferase [Aestuariibacter salexigens]|uniref:methyltransferase n=1 Tax=Aestuariibacter salexigens TaxID=226010 RepID=UPI00042707FB|nr:methyltransferase [Aestuariibacter salexigens]
MLSLPSQLLLRNQDIFTEGHWLLVNPTEAYIFNDLGRTQTNGSLAGFHQFYDVYEQCSQFANQYFGAQVNELKACRGAVVYLPKSKAHLAMLLHNLAFALPEGATIMLVGANNAGIKSAGKLLSTYGSRVQKVDAAKHCGLYAVTVEQQVKTFAIEDYVSWRDYKVGLHSCRIASLPGVFSHRELDPGTQLLLENLTEVPDGRILDFACGAGVIGCFAAQQNPSINVVMTDFNALALYCARQSCSQNHVDAEILPSDGLKNITGKFSAIYTNPPFHGSGTQTDYAVTECFIRDIAAHMQPSASLTLVANRFLKYPDALQNQFGKFSLLAQTGKFSVYHCVKH